MPTYKYKLIISLFCVVVLLAATKMYVAHSNTSPCVKNAKGEVCTNENYPYAEVPSANQAPVLLNQVPAALQEKLPITEGTYEELTNPSHLKNHN